MASAVHDPVGTIRRGITNWGFWHLIKLDQPQDAPCWDIYDAYGSTVGGMIGDTFLTDAEVDARNNTQVVYVPLADEQWARIHDLPVGEDRNESNIV